MILPGFPKPIGASGGPIFFVGENSARPVANSVTVSRPAGITAGDMIIGIAMANTTVVPSASGWTSVIVDTSTNPALGIFWKKAASETDYTLSFSGSTGVRGTIIALRNANGVTAGSLTRASGTSVSASSVNLLSGSALVSIFGYQNSVVPTVTPPSGMSELTLHTAQPPQVAIYGDFSGSPGASGSKTIGWGAASAPTFGINLVVSL